MSVIRKHISEKDFRKELELRRDINPVRYNAIIKYLDESLNYNNYDLRKSYIYHTDDAFFYICSFGLRPAGDLDFVFFNKEFIIFGSIIGNLLKCSLNGNLNNSTEECKKLIMDQITYIIKNSDIFMLESLTNENITFEFTGDVK